jgi:hypothetical protein
MLVTPPPGAEDGRRPPAGDVPAAEGGGLDLSKENYHSSPFARVPLPLMLHALLQMPVPERLSLCPRRILRPWERARFGHD